MSHQTTRTQITHCPGCRRPVDAAIPAYEPATQPSPGDMSMCLNCGVVLVFTESLGVRLLLHGELEELPDDMLQQIWRCRRIVDAIKNHG